jgi:lysophospholipid hydrolase
MHSSDLAFYIVAQGNVHVHAKFPQSNDQDNHLLYNVSVGGTVSSFFSIISIFTADFQLPKSLANLDEFLNPPSEPITPVHRQIYQNMVAKASEPTTLVVIPAQAFKKLTCQFKTAAAHISQVILTRFQRTTFLIMYKYLGLTNELLEVEKRIYDDVGYGLPVHLFPQKLRDELRLKHRGSVSTTPKQPSANSSWLHNVQRPLIIQDESDIAETIFKCISHLIGVRKHTPQPSSLNTTVGPSNTEKLLFNQKRRNSHSSLPAKPFDTDDFSSTVSSKSFELSSDEETSTPMVQIQSFQEGHVLIHEQERSRGIYFLIDGVLKATAVPKKRFGQDLSNPPFNNGFLIHAGGLVGYLAALTSNVSFVTVTAQTDITVGFIPKDRLDKLVEQDPNAILCLSKRLLDQITPLVFQIDAALEWSQLNAGQVLFRQEDVASDIFFVLMGRLRALDQSETPKAIAEYGANESVGEMEVIMDRKRPFTLHAIRDSEIAIIPKTLFNILSTHYPEIMLTIARMIAEKSDSGSTYSHKSDQNLRTVCLFPVSSQVPILKFSDNLYDSLVHTGATVSRLDSTTVVNHLGRHAFKKLGRLKLASWLNEQEETHRIVIFIADSNITPWTRRCIRHVTPNNVGGQYICTSIIRPR